MKKLSVILMALQCISASAETVYEKTKIEIGQICGTSQNTNSPIGGALTTETTYTSKATNVETVEVIKYSCDEQEGNGKSEIWNDYYNRNEKMAALTSIKGVGNTIAELLIAGNYFQSKPKSWNAFSSVIKQAANEIASITCKKGRDGCIDAQWGKDVIGKFAEKNRKLLGYSVEGCTPVATSTTYQITSRAWEKDKKVRLTTYAKNLLLLPGECESFSAIFDGDNVTPVISGEKGIQNAIAADERIKGLGEDGFAQGTLTFVGQGRKQVTPPSLIGQQFNAATKSASFTPNSNFAGYTANADFASKCILTGSATITAADHWWSDEGSIVDTKTFEISGSAGAKNIQFTYNVAEGKHEVFQSHLSFQNCPFFNTNETY